MFVFPILSMLILLPLTGALLILLFIRGDQETVAKNARNTALWTSVATLLLSLTLLIGFDTHAVGFQFEEYHPWIEQFSLDHSVRYTIGYHLGIDGISIFFILLTTLLIPICFLAGWDTISHRVREYVIAFLFMEACIIGVFSALDFVVFYLFFEAMLIPMFLIIGIWGGENRVYAAFKFFLFTLVGSLLLLLALVYIYITTKTTDIVTLTALLPDLSLEVQKWLWLALFASFAVKVPMFPVHTWLPDAHVQAPTAGSVILAGVLLKIGGYGFLRFSLPMLPEASVYYTNFMYILSIIAVIYTSVVALMQEDMKKLIAYSSIAHMGFVTVGIFSFNAQGIEGSIVQMISHGLISAALFLSVGVLYDRMHTKSIAKFGGVVEGMPKYALCFVFFSLASIGLPGTSGFIGEFLVMAGSFQSSTLVTALIATGMVLGAAYMLWLVARVIFGEIRNDEVRGLSDINAREILFYTPLVLLVIAIGVYPSMITDLLHSSVKELISQVQIGLIQVADLPQQVTIHSSK